MGRFVTPAIILQVILTALLSSVFTSLGGSISWSFLGSTALSTSPVSDSLLLPEGLGYFHFEDYATSSRAPLTRLRAWLRPILKATSSLTPVPM
jgi:hypothetical protein